MQGRNILLAAASAAAVVRASQLPRDDVASVPQTRGFPEGVRHGALLGYVAAPDPTPPPKPPRFAAMNLLDEREVVNANTCGYFDNNGAWDWFICANSEAICSTSGTIRQCCHSTECSTTTFGSMCLDYSSCDSTRNPETYCCTYTTAYPYCTSYLWSTNRGDIFTFFGCGEASTSRVQILYASTEGVDIGISTTSGTTRAGGSTVPDPTSTGDPTTTTTSAPSSTAAPDNGSSTPVGAIVGGVVGGLAVIALLVFAIFFLVRRNRTNGATTTNADNSNSNNPAAQPFMASHVGSPAMHAALTSPGPHSPSAFQSIGYTGASPSPYQAAASPYVPISNNNPHHSMYSASVLSPQPTGTATASTSTPQHLPSQHVQAWAAGVVPPQPQSHSPPPPMTWAPQGAPGTVWQTEEVPKAGDLSYEYQGVQELPSNNPIGQFGGNQRAELG